MLSLIIIYFRSKKNESSKRIFSRKKANDETKGIVQEEEAKKYKVFLRILLVFKKEKDPLEKQKNHSSDQECVVV